MPTRSRAMLRAMNMIQKTDKEHWSQMKKISIEVNRREIRMWRGRNKRKKKDINFKRKWLIEKCSDSEDLILIPQFKENSLKISL